MNSSETVIDPVCGMAIKKSRAPVTREHGGVTFHLCSMECAAKFDADAEAYAAVSRLDLPGWGKTPHPDHVTKRFRPDA
jgi:YHS domain-containing protein